ncbi:MAG: sigma-70 family RNA polymerase sigma factor [Leptospirales bacterium]|nr:sigma-70 family RNA polymerase sigma factor [Leptospirales bacterium]
MTENTITLTEGLFRSSYGEILSSLVSTIGYRNIAIAEEALQDAFQKALANWPYSGVPENPAGWIFTVARNSAIDVLRRNQVEQNKLAELARIEPLEARDVLATAEDELARMILLCCSKHITPRSQVLLTLKYACGFSVREIAAIVDDPEENVKRAITRAREQLSEIPQTLQSIDEGSVRARFPQVIETLYAMFTAGYSASRGNAQLHRDVADSAIRLCLFFIERRKYAFESESQLRALAALMLLQFARFPARVMDELPVPLSDQDRTLWNHEQIALGMAQLQKSIANAAVQSRYHIEARIAAEHSTAMNFRSTNWDRIFNLYQQLQEIQPTPQVILNRIIAQRFAQGPAAALTELDTFFRNHLVGAHSRSILHFHYECTRADILSALNGPTSEGRESWNRALALSPTLADKKFVQQQLKKFPGDVPI